MQSGKLRHPVVLQVRTTSRDHGSVIETWGTLASVWAEVRPLEGRELYAAQQVNAELTTQIRIRFTQNFNTINRVLFGSRVYDVLSVVNPDERNRELVLQCRELN